MPQRTCEYVGEARSAKLLRVDGSKTMSHTLYTITKALTGWGQGGTQEREPETVLFISLSL